MENTRAPASVPPPGFAPGDVHQMPDIVAHFEREGVVVVLANSTSQYDVVIDPKTDRIVIEQEAVAGGAARPACSQDPVGSPPRTGAGGGR